MVRPLMTNPHKHGCRSRPLVASISEIVEGEGMHGRYIMQDRRISEVGKKCQDGTIATRLWNHSIGLLREQVGTLDNGFAAWSMQRATCNLRPAVTEQCEFSREQDKYSLPSHLFFRQFWHHRPHEATRQRHLIRLPQKISYYTTFYSLPFALCPIPITLHLTSMDYRLGYQGNRFFSGPPHDASGAAGDG